MHKVLCATLEAGQLEQIFKEAFRTLVDEIDQFFSQIETETKFAKMRVRMDLLQLQNNIEALQFDAERKDDICAVAIQKIKSLINAKCGVQQKEEKADRGEEKKGEE